MRDETLPSSIDPMPAPFIAARVIRDSREKQEPEAQVLLASIGQASGTAELVGQISKPLSKEAGDKAGLWQPLAGRFDSGES